MRWSLSPIILSLIVGLQVSCTTSLAQQSTSQPGSAEPRVKPIPIEEMTAEQKELLGIVDGHELPKRATMNFVQNTSAQPRANVCLLPDG